MAKDLQLEPFNATASAIVIWLHGLGATADDFYVVGQRLQYLTQSPLRFIFPQAPSLAVTIANRQMIPAWYDIIGLDLKSREDQAGLQTTMQRLDQIIQTQITAGIPANRIFLAGFSQGSAAALYIGLRYPQTLGGLIGYSGYLPFAATLNQEAHIANAQTPIFLAHGTEDQVVQYAWGEASYAVLTRQAYPVTWRTYKMGHEVCEQQIMDTGKWLQKQLQI